MISKSHYKSMRCWVSTLGTSKSWREVNGAVLQPLFTLYVEEVCTDEAIYFFGSYDYESYIVTFNVRTENFKIILEWVSMDLHAWFYNLLELKVKLVVVDCSKAYIGEMDLWILQSFEIEQQVKHSIDVPQMNLMRTYFMFFFSSSTDDGEIMFITSSV